ncbi:hypothetical protein [Actinacidiphila sp. bgisy144]|uniref:hypothetical protein n=1 Tax=Actinacidiphila sp. bgisy144 TaxID=3413791 RepID=UPI003EBD88DD
MLALPDIGLIVMTTVICTAAVTLLAGLALHANRRGPVASQFAIVVAGAVTSIVSSILAVMVEMFISTHDLTVLVWVIAISTVISLATTWLTISRAVRRSVGRLSASARHLAAGAVLEPAEPGWREFNDLHAGSPTPRCSSHRPVRRWRSSTRPGGSSSRGSRTTCAPRWPASAR